MKKILTKIMSISLLLTMALGVNAKAAGIDNFSIEDSMENVQIIDITREEYLQTKAEIENISLKEADRIDKLQTEESIRNEISSKLTMSRSSIPPTSGKPVYKQVFKTHVVGASGSFSSRVKSTVNVKLLRYNDTSYGVYQKFSEVQAKSVLASGSGTFSIEEGAISTDIHSDTGYGNSLNLMFNGNVLHVIGIGLSADAKKAGFSVSGTLTYYARKDYDVNTNFTSNWDLS